MVVALAVLPSGCAEPDDLSDGQLRLSAALSELSGMVAIDAQTLACVQDELGAVFLVDLAGKRPTRMVPFGKSGDYEGIAGAGKGLFVLRSDGRLHELRWRGSELIEHQAFELPVAGEFEGLCLDATAEQLLVLPKGPVAGKDKEKKRRRVLAFHLLLRAFLPEPVVTLKIADLEEQIEARNLAGPRRTTDKGKVKVELELDATELLSLPGGDLLVLSPKDRLLLRVDRKGDVVATRGLDLDLLPQPEAMALLPDGRLLLGSEGRGGPARVAVVPIPE